VGRFASVLTIAGEENAMKDRDNPQAARPPATTTDAGIPAASDEHSLTAGPNGPILLQDHYLIQKMQAFNRERVPERVVHAKGGGAFGYFEVTADVAPWTGAAFLNKIGKRTPVLARFSTVAGEQGYADTDRDPRGFALKSIPSAMPTRAGSWRRARSCAVPRSCTRRTTTSSKRATSIAR
jgi:catalase